MDIISGTVVLNHQLMQENAWASPYPVDWDDDGDVDILVAVWCKGIYYYENIDNEFPSKVIFWSSGSGLSPPNAVDWDNDGDKDLIIGRHDGRVGFLQNDGSDNFQFADLLQDTMGNPIDVGFDSAPFLVDIDMDSDLDLIIGESAGRLFYYKNRKEVQLIDIFDPKGPLKDDQGNDIDVGGPTGSDWSHPWVMDLNNDNKLDLLIGANTGGIRHYDNQGESFEPPFPGDGFQYIEAIPTHFGGSRPFYKDWDGDDKLDLVVGTGDGAVRDYDVVLYGGIPSFSLDVGNDGDNEWSFGGQRGEIHTTNDFSAEINEYLASHWGDADQEGNIKVPLKLEATGPGILRFFNLHIVNTGGFESGLEGWTIDTIQDGGTVIALYTVEDDITPFEDFDTLYHRAHCGTHALFFYGDGIGENVMYVEKTYNLESIPTLILSYYWVQEDLESGEGGYLELDDGTINIVVDSIQADDDNHHTFPNEYQLRSWDIVEIANLNGIDLSSISIRFRAEMDEDFNNDLFVVDDILLT
jgi:hypothetical protein